MCGITGIINKDGRSVDKGSLMAMTNKIQHRGPDDSGCYIDGSVGLGHRRLTIIDLADHAGQPFESEDRNYILIFNGAIFNYLEIKEELQSLGHTFATTSDTEVLLKSYVQWGPQCVDKFNGMWAFAIYDKIRNIIFCSRDRFGIKPFYYYVNEKKFVFASEIKAIAELEQIRKVNVQIILQYIQANFTDHSNETFFQGVLKLPGSHSLIYNLKTHTFKIYKYYEIDFQPEIAGLNLNEAIKKFEEEFEKSVHIRLRADVKIGVALSGGLDSSYVTAVAAKYYNNLGKKFNAVTVGSLKKEEDESYLASVLTKALHVNHFITTPTADEFEKIFREVVYALEEPFGGLSIFMQSFLMKEAQKHDIKVLLDGQGADEVLLGYSRYTAAFLRVTRIRHKLKFLLNLKKHYNVSLIDGFKNYFYFSNFYTRKTYLKYRGLNLKNKYKKLIDYTHLKELTESYKDIFSMQKNEIFWGQIPQLLRWQDINSMKNGIETRLPFLDHRLVEVCLSFNHKFKFHNGWSKYLIRKNLAKHVPDQIVWNKKKIGFNAPLNEWWPRSPHILDAINASKIIGELFSKKFKYIKDRELEWRLYNIAVWEKMYQMEIEA